MKRRRSNEEDYDFLKEEGVLRETCMCSEESWNGCPLHDPLLHDRKRKKSKVKKEK